MSDTDQSIYTLRYNQISQAIEGFGGGFPMWTNLVIQNPDPVAGITPTDRRNCRWPRVGLAKLQPSERCRSFSNYVQ